MLLAIDVGNTNLVLALGSETDGGLAEAGYRIETASVTDAGSCESAIRHVLGDLVGEIADAVIASVVPAVTPVLAEAVTRITGTAPLVVGEAGVELGIGVNIDVPAQAGADRLVNAVGAMASHELPAILLDFGTATTLDLVAADGTYEGGSLRRACPCRSKRWSVRPRSCRGLSCDRLVPICQSLEKIPWPQWKPVSSGAM